MGDLELETSRLKLWRASRRPITIALAAEWRLVLKVFVNRTGEPEILQHKPVAGLGRESVGELATNFEVGWLAAALLQLLQPQDGQASHQGKLDV